MVDYNWKKKKRAQKVHVFIWLVMHRSLNTSDKLQRESPSICCLCLKEGVSLDHILPYCPFSHSTRFSFFQVLNLAECFPWKIDGWLMESLGGKSCQRKAKILWNCAVRAILWMMWKERIHGTFENWPSLVDSFWRNVQHSSILLGGVQTRRNSFVIIAYSWLQMIGRLWYCSLLRFRRGSLPPHPIQRVFSILCLQSRNIPEGKSKFCA